MKDRPFALLGVNCDEDREVAKWAVARERLNGPSWWDGKDGAIRAAWQVDSYPTVYLIDHTGVIRKKWVGQPNAEELDAAVEEAVRAAERAAAR